MPWVGFFWLVSPSLGRQNICNNWREDPFYDSVFTHGATSLFLSNQDEAVNNLVLNTLLKT